MYKKIDIIYDVVEACSHQGNLYLIRCKENQKIEKCDKNLNVTWESPESDCRDFFFTTDRFVYSSMNGNKTIGLSLPDMQIQYEIEGGIRNINANANEDLSGYANTI